MQVGFFISVFFGAMAGFSGGSDPLSAFVFLPLPSTRRLYGTFAGHIIAAILRQLAQSRQTPAIVVFLIGVYWRRLHQKKQRDAVAYPKPMVIFLLSPLMATKP
jgi:uncharacterized membrane protein YbhN (UPF0104 family)